jgi:RHS repeat-associated protein
MSGISSRAANTLENKHKYNGIEYENSFDINIGEAFFRTHDPQLGRWWQIDPKPNASISQYASMENNPIRFIDPLGDTIVLPNEADRTAMLGYLNRALGGDHFSFNDKNQLQFTGNIKDFKGDKKDLVNGMLGVMGADYTATIKMSGFTAEETKTLDEQAKPNALGEKGGGVSLISIDNKTNKIVGATILIREGDLQPVTLYNEVYYYKDANGVLQKSDTRPFGVNATLAHAAKLKDGIPQTVPNTAANVIFHEIGHLIYENKSQKDVIRYENKARKLLGMPQRSSSDPEHQ